MLLLFFQGGDLFGESPKKASSSKVEEKHTGLRFFLFLQKIFTKQNKWFLAILVKKIRICLLFKFCVMILILLFISRFIETQREPEKKRTSSSKKMPAGAVSIFGGKHLFLIIFNYFSLFPFPQIFACVFLEL